MQRHALRGLGWVGTMAVAAVLAAAPAQARTYDTQDTAAAAATTHLRHEVSWWRGRTWQWQDQAGQARTRTSYSEKYSTGLYLLWVKRLWVHRAAAARHAAHQRRTVHYTADWATAVQQVQHVWPGTAGWLLSCSSTEGGWGGFVWRGHLPYPDSGEDVTPGGWLQYMQSTWRGNYASAVADAASRGYRLPGAGYYDALGQAVAGAWAVSQGHTSQWTGRGC